MVRRFLRPSIIIAVLLAWLTGTALADYFIVIKPTNTLKVSQNNTTRLPASSSPSIETDSASTKVESKGSPQPSPTPIQTLEASNPVLVLPVNKELSAENKDPHFAQYSL